MYTPEGLVPQEILHPVTLVHVHNLRGGTPGHKIEWNSSVHVHPPRIDTPGITTSSNPGACIQTAGEVPR